MSKVQYGRTKRCKSLAPRTGIRCAKDRNHPGLHANEAEGIPSTFWPGVPISPGMPPTPEQRLTRWWMAHAKEEVDRTVPKAIEYSSTDLADIGHQLARTAGREVDSEEAAELGIFFYLQGKLSRWAGAIAQGKRPSDDTIFDIGVYCRMAQRIRDVGGWPGIDDAEQES